MTSRVQVEYTETFYQLLDSLITYLSDYSSEASVIERLEEVIARFEKLVCDNPQATNISPSLLELGIKDFREFHSGTFRIVYRIRVNNDIPIIIADVITQQKQDLEQLLVRHCLLFK